jgi:ADP-heptose:LPS heptosyltransferase
MPNPARILVIKHSAFGDFILSTGSFKAIRAYHAGDHVTLLTTEGLRALGEACPHFDEVWVDPRPSLVTPLTALAHVGRLRRAGFDRVYDLQRNDRTAAYFRALWPQPPEWVGVVRGCSHRYRKPTGRKIHIVDREAAQLALAGVHAEPVPDLSWLGAATAAPLAAAAPAGARRSAGRQPRTATSLPGSPPMGSSRCWSAARTRPRPAPRSAPPAPPRSTCAGGPRSWRSPPSPAGRLRPSATTPARCT